MNGEEWSRFGRCPHLRIEIWGTRTRIRTWSGGCEEFFGVQEI